MAVVCTTDVVFYGSMYLLALASYVLYSGKSLWCEKQSTDNLRTELKTAKKQKVVYDRALNPRETKE